MEISLSQNNKEIKLTKGFIFEVNIDSIDELKLSINNFNNKTLCCINCLYIDDKQISKNIKGNYLLKNKFNFDHNVTFAFLHLIMKELKKTDFFLIGTFGLDYKEVNEITKILEVLNSQRIRFLLLDVKTSKMDFKLKIPY
jgi:hypothetical protein